MTREVSRRNSQDAQVKDPKAVRPDRTSIDIPLIETKEPLRHVVKHNLPVILDGLKRR